MICRAEPAWWPASRVTHAARIGRREIADADAMLLEEGDAAFLQRLAALDAALDCDVLGGQHVPEWSHDRIHGDLEHDAARLDDIGVTGEIPSIGRIKAWLTEPPFSAHRPPAPSAVPPPGTAGITGV